MEPQHPSFVDFRGRDRWSVWTFVLDLEANFPLASSAGGGMPRHPQVEAGFDEDASCVADDGKRTSASFEEDAASQRRSRHKIEVLLDCIVQHLNIKDGVDEADKQLKQVAKHSAM